MKEKFAKLTAGNSATGYIYFISDKPSPSYKTYSSKRDAERILKKQGYKIK